MKNGIIDGKQLYKCYACGRQFRGGHRLDSSIIWEQYYKGKQTYAQLGEQYGCSVKTIQRKIDAATASRETHFSAVANLLMDTTYFGRGLGVMVFKDSISGKILFKQ